MKKRIAVFAVVLVAVCMPVFCVAQHSRETGNNAALQYYSAFLQMKDADLSDADAKELGEIIAGTRPYDDVKFGKLVESNAQAVETMMVGAELPDCDWGFAPLAKKFGAETPVPYFGRSRALGRLDILFVLRAWSKGDQEKAVHALSSGMLYAKHVASGGPLLPVLIGKMLLVQQLSITNRLVDSGKLTSEQRETLRTALAQLDTFGSYWQAAINTEMGILHVSLDHIRSEPDQRQYYKSSFGKDAPPDFHITQQDYADLEKVAAAYSRTLSDDNAAPVQSAINASTKTVQIMIPNPERLVKSKQELQKALEETKAKIH
ncbi:MAG TPA: hypothetical protein VFK06_25420 [Candidatus Angelobacter sp.]|nr:hypothetical protein [Candidatus Angelobacter sp.]